MLKTYHKLLAAIGYVCAWVAAPCSIFFFVILAAAAVLTPAQYDVLLSMLKPDHGTFMAGLLDSVHQHRGVLGFILVFYVMISCSFTSMMLRHVDRNDAVASQISMVVASGNPTAFSVFISGIFPPALSQRPGNRLEAGTPS